MRISAIFFTIECNTNALAAECHASSNTSNVYASGPNDVWSLGIILVNLTCGRNPWKRASMDDSTFQAYLKNPTFLSNILPLSPELDSILRRIFECDPQRRVTIPELRYLVARCPRFTTRPTVAPPTPPPEKEGFTSNSALGNVTDFSLDPHVRNEMLLPSTSRPCIPFNDHKATLTRSEAGSCSSDDGSMFSSDSSCSAGSSGLDEPHYNSPLVQYVPAVAPINFYGNFFPLDTTSKPLIHQLPNTSIPVY